jgi:hypothetical protein
VDAATSAPATQTWAALPITTVNVDGPSTYVPTRTGRLPAGPASKLAWVFTTKGQQVVHLGDTDVRVDQGIYPTSSAWGGFVSRVDDGMRLMWSRPGSPDVDLGGVAGFESVPSSGFATAAAFPSLVHDTSVSPPWRVVLAGPDGCRQELSFTAASAALANSLGGSPPASCRKVSVLGFVGPGEVAAVIGCRGGQRVVTTAGRVFPLAGLPHPLWATPMMSSRSEVLIGYGDNLENLQLRAFEMPSGRPLWAHTFSVSMDVVSLGDFTFSPSGRRVLMPMPEAALVIDTRTGAPVAALRYPATIKQVAFEDDEHLLLVDNGEVVPYRASPTKSAWLVRCELGGSCELASEVRPPRPRVWMRLIP